MLRATVSDAVATLVVTVTAPDISVPLIFNIGVVDGIASGTITVPAGSNRLVTVRAFDDNGVETHMGQATISVHPGVNPSLTIQLLALLGDVNIDVTIGSFFIAVDPAVASIEVGATVQLTALLYDADLQPVEANVQWATSHPGRATVDGSGLVTGVGAGEVQIVAIAQGVAAVAEITVTGASGGGDPQDPATLSFFGMNAGLLDLGGGSATITLTARTPAGNVAMVSLGLRSADGIGSQDRSCYFVFTSSEVGGLDEWVCSLEFVQGAHEGTWRPYVTLYGGTIEELTYEELGSAGFPDAVTIENSGPTDLDGPVLTGIAVTSATFPHGSPISYQVLATDAGAGVAGAAVAVQVAGGGPIYLNAICVANNITSGTPAMASITCESIPQLPLPSGDYVLAHVLLQDRAGNWSNYTAMQVAGLGLPTPGLTIVP